MKDNSYKNRDRGQRYSQIRVKSRINYHLKNNKKPIITIFIPMSQQPSNQITPPIIMRHLVINNKIIIEQTDSLHPDKEICQGGRMRYVLILNAFTNRYKLSINLQTNKI